MKSIKSFVPIPASKTLAGIGLVAIFAAAPTIALAQTSLPIDPPVSTDQPQQGDKSARTPGDKSQKAGTKDGTASGGASIAGGDFGKLDLNGNGSLSREEMRADTTLGGRFEQADQNGDGQVTQREFRLAASPQGIEPSTSGTDPQAPGSTGTKRTTKSGERTERGDGGPDAEDLDTENLSR